MALKLFHETGYSSVLGPGETRVGTHPAWVIAAVSLWAGCAANVALWRELAGSPASGSPPHVLGWGLLVAGAAGSALSLFGWRKTLKPAASAVLLLAALMAVAIWSQALPLDASLLSRKPSSLVVPSWAALLRWQVPASLVGLALVPAVWVWRRPLRRLPLARQAGVNATGVLLGAAGAALGALLLGDILG